ncbi:MAG: alpha/beta hydrolase [Rhodospirillaceae bacterium]|nr:alpha/beta hydrolase [Rhodospirillaceae bacterium]
MREPDEAGHADLDDHRLEFNRFESREPGAPSLVLLHEGLGSVAMWRDFPAKLAATTGAEVFVYSRRGYGTSSPRAMPYDVDYMHAEARETLPRLFEVWGLEAPVLVGHSDGASVALIHAAQENPRAQAVCVMAPHIMVEPISIQSIEVAREQFRTTDLAAKLARYHDDPEHAFRGWNDIWLHPDFLNWDIRPLLPAIRCPVMAIQGEDDPYGTMAQVDGIEAASGGPVALVKLPGCGHSPHREAPDETLRALKTFVEKIGQ